MNRIYVLAVTAAAFTTVNATDKVDFTKDVKPVLEKYCLTCHGTEKPKAKLQLTTRANAIKGGENGPALEPGHPEQSPLYTTTTLPPTDDKAMPPRGDR